MIRPIGPLLVLLIGALSCNGSESTSAPSPAAEPMAEPASHVPPPPKYVAELRPQSPSPASDPFPDWPPTLHHEHLRAKPGELHPTPSKKSKTTSLPVPEQVEDRVDSEVKEWLADASTLDPGCLLNNIQPPIWVPSPEGLRRLLSSHPAGFNGVAKEALLCRLGIQRLTAAEIYGSSAFLPAVSSARLHLVGGDQALGVVVIGLYTEVPRGEGTAVLVLDERGDQWFVRAARWVPWEGGGTNRRVVSVKGARMANARRQSVIIRQEANEISRQIILNMSPSDQLALVFDEPTRTPDFRQKLIVRGPGWPRAVIGRRVERDQSGWSLNRWESAPNDVYQRVLQVQGSFVVPDARAALAAGFARDVQWLIGRFPSRERAQADLLALRAQGAVALGQRRTAKKYWRKAIKAADATPEHRRDYGLYLATLKRPGRAASWLAGYLEERPDALDRSDIESVLSNLGSTP